MTRVAAVDIGTNSTRLLIADVNGEELADVDRRSTVTRLGEGVDAGRRLQPGPIARTRAVLDDYRREIAKYGVERTLAVATSAARDAANGPEFMAEIGESFGFVTRILSGDQEAVLTRRGVGAMGEATLLLDVGGGSTELTVGDFRVSLDVGSVRLTERFLAGDPPAASELEAAATFTRGLLPALEVEDAVGVAGTVTQLHALIGDLTREAVERELQR
jgi:exopolyphosphatase/guanosine-5'-triphosphate,3'-diphosphate pyrophosphatase